MKKINENDIKALETAETEIRDTLREIYEIRDTFLKFANGSIEATNQKKSFMKAIFEN